MLFSFSVFSISGLHKLIMMMTFLGSVLTRCILVYGKNDLVWLSMVVGISAILNAPVKPLIDTAIMNLLVDKSSYGRSRLYGQLGFGFGSFVVDQFIQKSIGLMFYVHFCLSIPTLLLMYFFDPSKKTIANTSTQNVTSPPRNGNTTVSDRSGTGMITALKHTFNNFQVSIFFFVVFIVGISSGIIENFAYVRLAEIQTQDKSAFGILRLASSLTGGPMFWVSGSIIKKLGVHGVFSLSLFAYVLRFIIYGSVSNIWYALPAEMLRGFTFALFWSASTFYVYEISPKHLTATMVSF
jgi:hypothetical protein